MPLNELSNSFATCLKESIVRFNERMSLYTSFKIGGNADIFVVPSSLDELVKIVNLAHNEQVAINIIGNGSNLLVSDNGVRSVVVSCKTAMNKISFSGNNVSVGAGCSLETLSEEAAKMGLSGLEMAVGIPGTVGGALIMNAGAHDYNIGNIVKNVTILDLEGNKRVLDKKELSFNYRYSNLRELNCIILNTELVLAKGKKDRLFKIMNNELQDRMRKFPLDYPNAGSIFKRPVEGFPGKWIEMAGCKGMRVGDAEVSTKHANFIINNGNASANDVMQLIRDIKKVVFDKFAVSLKEEILYWGDM